MLSHRNLVGKNRILRDLVLRGGLYPYAPFRLAIFSWLATARQEKIVSLKGAYGYNLPPITRETCTTDEADSIAPCLIMNNGKGF